MTQKIPIKWSELLSDTCPTCQRVMKGKELCWIRCKKCREADMESVGHKSEEKKDDPKPASPVS